jgi:hypothetical protein
MSFDFLLTISFLVTAYQVFRIVQPAVVKKGRGLRLQIRRKERKFHKRSGFKNLKN